MNSQHPIRSRPLVYVVGDLMLDVDHRVEPSVGFRSAQEAPVPVVPSDPRAITAFPGGAGNVASNLAAQGVDVVLFSNSSTDRPGLLVEEHLKSVSGPGYGSIGRIPHPAPAMTTKTRHYVGNRLVVRVDSDVDTHPILPTPGLCSLEKPDAIVLTDYGRGALSRDAVSAWSRVWCDVPVFGDPKASRGRVWHRGSSDDHRITALVMNETEFSEYAPITPDWSPTEVGYAAAEEVFPLIDAETLIVKRGPLGSVVIRHGSTIDKDPSEIALFASGAPISVISVHGGYKAVEVSRIDPQRTRGVSSVQGAGDTYLAALVAATTKGLSVLDAAVYASAAAGIAVSRPGTSVVSAADTVAEVRSRIPRGLGVTDLASAAILAKSLRSVGLTVGYTNGCFDVRLHAGHLHTFRRAAERCDFLFVAVDSDERVRRLKGPHRPVIHETDRTHAVASVSGVGTALVFRDLEETVRAIRPHVIFKGGDYDPTTMPETPIVESWGGRVEMTGNVACTSTTDLVTRLWTSSPTPRPTGT